MDSKKEIKDVKSMKNVKTGDIILVDGQKVRVTGVYKTQIRVETLDKQHTGLIHFT